MNVRNSAQRRYIARFVPVMIAYVVVLFASTWATKEYAPQGLALYLLSVLPAVPILAVLWIMGVYLREEQDEYVRDRLAAAMLGGIGLTLAVQTVWGFLELGANVGHFPTYLSFPLWCGAYGVVHCLIGLRDRSGGEAQ